MGRINNNLDNQVKIQPATIPAFSPGQKSNNIGDSGLGRHSACDISSKTQKHDIAKGTPGAKPLVHGAIQTSKAVGIKTGSHGLAIGTDMARTFSKRGDFAFTVYTTHKKAENTPTKDSSKAEDTGPTQSFKPNFSSTGTQNRIDPSV